MKASDLEILVIKSYRKVSKPIYHFMDSLGINPIQCLYEPSCSFYAEEAIRKYGVIKGTKMTAKRISRCRPGYGGYDPVI